LRLPTTALITFSSPLDLGLLLARDVGIRN